MDKYLRPLDGNDLRGKRLFVWEYVMYTNSSNSQIKPISTTSGQNILSRPSLAC